MAFTIEEIEKALITENTDWQLRFPVNAGLQQNINYPIISDYLTVILPHLMEYNMMIRSITGEYLPICCKTLKTFLQKSSYCLM